MDELSFTLPRILQPVLTNFAAKICNPAKTIVGFLQQAENVLAIKISVFVSGARENEDSNLKAALYLEPDILLFQ